uniref:Immunoglobulin V-set domain-containing protein n=1 Tax=Gasterosteus aculeatus TaxID=69293 RepID=G3NAJ9_GASAC
MHAMLSLPAAALCALSSALVAMAAQLIQEDLTLTRTVGGKVSFSCGGTDQCPYEYVYWYQKRDTGTFTWILWINKRSGSIDKSYKLTKVRWVRPLRTMNVSSETLYFSEFKKKEKKKPLI